MRPPPTAVALPSETTRLATIPAFHATITRAPATNTPNSIKPANTFIPSATPQATTTNEVGYDLWFQMPKISLPRTLNAVSVRAYKGIKIPALPDDILMELHTSQPYGGELPYEPIHYQLFLVRKGDARMLWLGIALIETRKTGKCCGETQYRIYDSIPLTPVHDNDLLISFVCGQQGTQDIFLIVIAEQPKPGANATNIRSAWRIDQETTTLKAVSTQGILCSINHW